MPPCRSFAMDWPPTHHPWYRCRLAKRNMSPPRHYPRRPSTATTQPNAIAPAFSLLLDLYRLAAHPEKGAVSAFDTVTWEKTFYCGFGCASDGWPHWSMWRSSGFRRSISRSRGLNTQPRFAPRRWLPGFGRPVRLNRSLCNKSGLSDMYNDRSTETKAHVLARHLPRGYHLAKGTTAGTEVSAEGSGLNHTTRRRSVTPGR